MRRSSTFLIPLLYVIILLVVSDSLFAQWTQSYEESVEVSLRRDPNAIVSDGYGGAYCVVEEPNLNYHWDEVIVKKINHDGILGWGGAEVWVSVNLWPQVLKSAVSDGAHGLILAWEDHQRHDTTWMNIYDSSDVYLQRVAPDGSLLWGPDGINLREPIHGRIDMEGAEVISDGEGGAFVYYYLDPYTSNNKEDEIYLQHISSEGELLWTNGVAIDTSKGFSRYFMDMVLDDTDGVIISMYWTDADYNDFIRFHHVTDFGFVDWVSESYPIWGYYNYENQMLPDGEGGAYFYHWSVTEPFNYFINRISSSGDLLWGDQGVELKGNTADNYSGLASWTRLQDNSVVFAYEFWNDDSLFYKDIYAQRISPTGELLWETPIPIVDHVIEGQILSPDMITLPDTSVFILWSDTRDWDSLEYDVYGQKLGQHGEVQWQENGIPIIRRIGKQFFPVATSDGTDGAIVAWTSGWPFGSFAQHINGDGELGNPKPVAIEENRSFTPQEYILHPAYPNPFNPTTTIRYDTPELSSVTLTIYDVMGRNVRDLVSEIKPIGQFEVKWNGTDASGKQVSTGVYFARLTAGEVSSVVKMVYLK